MEAWAVVIDGKIVAVKASRKAAVAFAVDARQKAVDVRQKAEG
jgi:hypothetical protein